MNIEDKQIIHRYASGEIQLRPEAIEIYRNNILEKDLVEIRFMKEVDNPCPDLMLKSIYRKEVLKQYES